MSVISSVCSSDLMYSVTYVYLMLVSSCVGVSYVGVSYVGLSDLCRSRGMSHITSMCLTRDSSDENLILRLCV